MKLQAYCRQSCSLKWYIRFSRHIHQFSTFFGFVLSTPLILMPIRKNKHKASLHKQVSISYGFRFSTALILQRSETERIYMKRASTSKLIWIQTQFCSQNKKAKDLPKISETSTVMKSVNSMVFWLLRKETCEGIYCIINPRGNFSFLSQRWGRRRKICCFFQTQTWPFHKELQVMVFSMPGKWNSTRTS